MFNVEGSERGFLVDGLTGDAVIGRWVSAKSDPEEASIPLAELLSTPLKIRQYIGELQIHYTSPTEFVWHTRLRIPQMKWLYGRVSRFCLARKLLLRSDRINVLRILLDHATEVGGGKSKSELMSDIYGHSWTQHPRGKVEFRYTQLLLDSLVELGEISVVHEAYRITPRAVSSIIEHDLEDRRHQDSLVQQKWMVRLTILLAIIGGIQAYQTWISAASP
jgi:hypothetical protein